MIKCRFRWQFCNDRQEVGLLHVDDPLFDSNRDHPMMKSVRSFQNFLKEHAGDDAEVFVDLPQDIADPLTDHQKELIDNLKSIRGVVKVHTDSYMIVIKRSPVFSWEELTPGIQDVVRVWLGADSAVVLPPINQC